MYGATLEQSRPWIARFERRLDDMLNRICASFPGGCHIFLANIYDPTDGSGDLEAAGLGLAPWPDAASIHREYNAVIRRAAVRREDTTLVDVHAAFLGHGIHCTQPWHPSYRTEDPHYWYYDNLEDPNERGYDAIRRLFLLEMARHLQAQTASTPPPPPAGAPSDARTIVRGPTEARRLALVFTGHKFSEGADLILSQLAVRTLKASFFLTGDFLVKQECRPVVQRIVAGGHYLGPHSDRHLLYGTWESPMKLLVTRDQFEADLTANLEKIRGFGVPRPRYFLPPYEHANADIAAWTQAAGLVLVNYTPGTRSHADYTEDAARNFASSQSILDSILRREREDPSGLNGYLLLLHVGVGPGRTDKFAARFSEPYPCSRRNPSPRPSPRQTGRGRTFHMMESAH